MNSKQKYKFSKIRLGDGKQSKMISVKKWKTKKEADYRLSLLRAYYHTEVLNKGSCNNSIKFKLKIKLAQLGWKMENISWSTLDQYLYIFDRTKWIVFVLVNVHKTNKPRKRQKNFESNM